MTVGVFFLVIMYMAKYASYSWLVLHKHKISVINCLAYFLQFVFFQQINPLSKLLIVVLSNNPQAKIDPKWATFIGNHGTITIPLETIPPSLQKSINWLIYRASPTLVFFQEVGDLFGTNLIGQVISYG